MKIKKLQTLLILFIISMLSVHAQKADSDTAYTKVLKQRVNKFLPEIVDTMDVEKYSRVQELIVNQYKNLSEIHDTRDKQVKMFRESTIDKQVVNKKIDSIKTASALEIFYLHTVFIAQLASELDLEQVDMVKNGMTYSVMPNTYNVYLEMLPDLTEEQKRFIKAKLYEARELAMDKGSSKKKHETFGKYKGKITNFLSQQGYDLKQAEKDMWERKKAMQSPGY